MPKNDYLERLSAMQDGWEQSRKDYETTFGGERVDDGEYVMTLTKVGFMQSNEQNMMIGRNWIVTEECEFDGCGVFDVMMLDDRSKKFIRLFIDQCGYDQPESIADLPELFEQIEAEQLKFNTIVSHSIGKNGMEYTNVRIISLYEEGEGGTDTSTETNTVETDTHDQDPGNEDESELINKMVAFTGIWGLPCDDMENFDALRNAIAEQEGYPENLIDDSERELLTELGLEEKIVAEEKTPPPPPPPKPSKKGLKKSSKTTVKSAKKTVTKSVKKSAKKSFKKNR